MNAEPRGREPKLVLVRHGQASLGSDDYDRLSDRGHQQASRTAERLAAQLGARPLVWSGTLLRHRQTAAPLLDRQGHDAIRSTDLDELSTAGLVRAALRDSEALGISVPPREQFGDPVRHLPSLLAWFPEVLAAWQEKGMEDEHIGSWANFSERVLRPRPRWEKAIEQGRDVIVFSSAGVIATVVAALSGRDLAWQRDLAVRLYNASVSELVFRERSWSLERCNCIDHLDAGDLRSLA